MIQVHRHAKQRNHRDTFLKRITEIKRKKVSPRANMCSHGYDTGAPIFQATESLGYLSEADKRGGKEELFHGKGMLSRVRYRSTDMPSNEIIGLPF